MRPQLLTGMGPKGPLLFLLYRLFACVQLCEIPEGNSQAIESLNVELLRVTEDATQEPNPSVYLGLRLSDFHNLQKESQYLQWLKEVFQPNSTSLPAPAGLQEHPKTGQLALYLLVLRAACQEAERQLVTQLKLYLHKEKNNIVTHHHPITNYYQYSLGVLALCIHGKKVDSYVVRKLLHAEEHGSFGQGRALSVDTEAMAGLAFICLTQATVYTPDLLAELGQAVHRVKGNILQAQTPTGTFGNIYSSPLAMQFLIALGTNKHTPECLKGMAALLEHLQQGDFRNFYIGSQLLPVLYGKSYVSIATMACQAERDFVEPSIPSPKSEPNTQGTMIIVHLVVKKPPQRLPLYKALILVPLGSSVLDVLKAAQNEHSRKFTFETQNTLAGPMLTAVMGVRAQEGDRNQWKLLQAPNLRLQQGGYHYHNKRREPAFEFAAWQGIADYMPADQETLLLKFSPR